MPRHFCDIELTVGFRRFHVLSSQSIPEVRLSKKLWISHFLYRSIVRD